MTNRNYHVCGKDDVAELITTKNITHVLTMLDYNESCIDPRQFFSVQHWKRLDFMDVEFPGHPAGPTIEDCQKILEWGKTLPDDANVLVHCHAGISRSTCATLGLMHQDFPDRELSVHKTEIIRIRPIARPNKLMARHFDQLFSREMKFEKMVWEIHEDFYNKVDHYNPFSIIR